MIVCSCEGVSDRDVQAAIRDGATDLHALSRCTGAGTSCGSCVVDLKAALARCGRRSLRRDTPTHGGPACR